MPKKAKMKGLGLPANVLQDFIYGYIEIKCVNESCNRIFKISRNNYTGGLYCCNMGCSLETYNNLNDNN